MPESAQRGPHNRADALERRAFPRRRGRGRVTVIPAEKPMAPGVSATVLDASQAGLLFTISKELAVGQRILVEVLPGAKEKRPTQLRAEVCRVDPSDKPAQFEVVCTFIDRLSYADLQAFC
jgi:PilZ domain